MSVEIEKILKEVRQFAYDYVSGGDWTYGLAIYLHDNGHISASPYAGSPSVASDCSDKILHVMEPGDYDWRELTDDDKKSYGYPATLCEEHLLDLADAYIDDMDADELRADIEASVKEFFKEI